MIGLAEAEAGDRDGCDPKDHYGKADGSGQELLLSMPGGDAVDPRWSPSGDAIAFVHVPSGGITAAQDATQERIVYVMDIRTKALARLSR